VCEVLLAVAKLVYQEDSYLRELYTRVTRVSGNKVFVEQTIFHPRSGGVDNDTGYIEYENRVYRVVNVYFDREAGNVVHELDTQPDFSENSIVKLVLDWDRRYMLMRLHTAAHIISGIMYSRYGALVTGGNISVDKAYDDYDLEVFDKKIFEEVIEEANKVVKRDLEVKIYWLPREQALKIPGVVKLASRAPPPDLEVLRIVEIPGVDIQADGGPHVKRTGEIGEIKLLDVVNKGKKRKRIYFTVIP